MCLPALFQVTVKAPLHEVICSPFIFLYGQSNPSRIITRHAWLGPSGRAPLPLHDVSSTLSSQKAARLWEVKNPKARILWDNPHSLLESHWLLVLLHTQKMSSLNRTFPFSWHIALASMGSFHIIQARKGFSTSQTSSQSPAPPLHSSTLYITLLSMSLTEFFSWTFNMNAIWHHVVDCSLTYLGLFYCMNSPILYRL